jgi:hypothetical protein
MKLRLADLGRLRYELTLDEPAPIDEQYGHFHTLIATYTWEFDNGYKAIAGWRTCKTIDDTYVVIVEGTAPPEYHRLANDGPEFSTWIECVNFIKTHLPCDEVAKTYESY